MRCDGPNQLRRPIVRGDTMGFGDPMGGGYTLGGGDPVAATIPWAAVIPSAAATLLGFDAIRAAAALTGFDDPMAGDPIGFGDAMGGGMGCGDADVLRLPPGHGLRRPYERRRYHALR